MELNRLYRVSCLKAILVFFPAFSFPSSGQDGYFQQEVNHRINVTLNDRKHELRAFETVEYINNSPDSLLQLYFHLWPNAYSGNNTALANQLTSLYGRKSLFKDSLSIGYIDSLDFRINSINVSWEELPGNADICIVHLNSVLLPGDTIYISTPFRVKIPEGNISRMGHEGYAYQISQWYPKPAVYDSRGWHQMPYLDQGEFFSEFGKYEVSINLPEDYIVGATGDLLTGDEVTRLSKLASLTEGSFSSPAKNVDGPSSEAMKTLVYTGNRIHDFAWFADRNFNVSESRIILPGSGREITTYALYNDDQATLWRNAIQYVNRSVLVFSQLIGDYPYNTFTAVQGALAAGSGMEYPGITVIGAASDPWSLDQVIAHEVCHSWFYSSIGSDERDYPFMDEGITSAYESRYLDIFYPGKKLWEVYIKNPRLSRFLKVDDLPVSGMEELEWLVQARNNKDQPADLPAQDYTSANYSNDVYFKTGKGFNLLRNYLGDSKFDSLMHMYYSSWGGRHPYPSDLRKIFEEGTGRNMSWFFDRFLRKECNTDYEVSDLEGDSVLVSNKGCIDSPFKLTGSRNGKMIFNEWYDGFSGKSWLHLPENGITEIVLNKGHELPELNYLNNNIRRNGIFRKADRIRASMLFTIEDPGRRTLMYTPLISWTRPDGFLAGIALNNGIMLSKPIEFSFMPLLRFRDPDLSGKGRIAINFLPEQSFLRKISLGAGAARFGTPMNSHYHILNAGIDFWLRNEQPVNQVDSKLFTRIVAASDLQLTGYEEPGKNIFTYQAGYNLVRASAADPYDASFGIEWGRSYVKTTLEIDSRYSYNYRNTGFDIRVFSGFMPVVDKARPFTALAPSGRMGRELYLFQGDFPDRFSSFSSENFWSRQMMIAEGGIVSPLNDSTGYSRWLVSVTFSSSLPGKAGLAPVKPFVSIVINDHAYHGSRFFYEAGIKAGIWDFFEIHVPLLVSENISSVRGSCKERIRFVFSLDSFLRIRLGR